jgi:hypothetical protein
MHACARACVRACTHTTGASFSGTHPLAVLLTTLMGGSQVKNPDKSAFVLSRDDW